MSARADAVQQQINEMRGTAQAIRKGIEKTTEQAADWQRKADAARKLVAVLEEKARIWDALADALDSGSLDDIAAPLGTGQDWPSNADLHALQGRLMAELADCDLDAWSIQCRELSTMLHEAHGGSREAIAIIAERLGIGYAEKKRNDGQLYVEAGGEIDGIPVKVWSLLDADDERPAEPAPADEHMDYAEADAVREIEREMAIEAGDESELDRQIAEDDARAERNYETHQANEAWLDAHPDNCEAEDAETEDGFTAEQLNGNACSVCGGAFGPGEALQPSGYVLDHGQLFAHTACIESEA